MLNERQVMWLLFGVMLGLMGLVVRELSKRHKK